MCALLGLGWVGAVETAKEPGAALGALVYSCVAVTSLLTRWVWGTLYDPWHLIVHYNLPHADGDIFHYQWQRFLAKVLWLGLMLLGTMAVSALVIWDQPRLLVLPLVQYGLAVATAIHAAALCPVRLRPFVGWFFPVMVVGLLTLDHAGKYTSPILGWFAHWAWWVPPFGWLNYAFQRGWVEGDRLALTLLLPALLPVWLVPMTWRRLRDRFVLGEPDLRPGWPPVDARQAELEEAAGEPVPTVAGPTAMEERLRACDFLQPQKWSERGFIERLVLAWLTERERVVLEFMMAPNPRWTRRFARMIRVAAVGAAFCLMPGNWAQNTGGVILAAAGVLGLVFVAQPWRGFASGFSGAMSVPTCALQPLGFREMYRVVFKVTLVRSTIVSAVLILGGGLLGWRWGDSPAHGADLAARVVLLWFALLPAMMLWHFSPVTNDTSQIGLSASLVFLLLGLAMVGFGIATFFVDWRYAVQLCLPAVAGLSGAIFLLYRRAWERGWFDLVRGESPRGD